METVKHDSDRAALRAAFAELRKMGWFARMNYWCCSTCANYDAATKLKEKGIDEEDMKIVFWHNQDDDAFRVGGRSWHNNTPKTDDLGSTLHLKFTAGRGTAFEVVGVLVKHGLNAYWSGDTAECIEVRPKDETPVMLRRQAS